MYTIFFEKTPENSYSKNWKYELERLAMKQIKRTGDHRRKDVSGHHFASILSHGAGAVTSKNL